MSINNIITPVVDAQIAKFNIRWVSNIESNIDAYGAYNACY